MNFSNFISLIAITLVTSLFPLLSLSQEELKLHNIDSIVSNINNSKYGETTDTLNNDIPTYNFFASTLQTSIADGAALKKYVHHVLNYDNSQKKIKTADYSSAFYYDQNTLIKVEESSKDRNGIFRVVWYFEKDKLLEFQMHPMPIDKEHYEKIREREQILQTLAKSFLEAFRLKHPST